MIANRIGEIAVIRCGHIEVLISPIEKSWELPESIKCQVNAKIAHPTGDFRYEASDVYFEVRSLVEFVAAIRRAVASNTGEAFLCCMSNFVRLNINRSGRIVQLNLEVEDYVPGAIVNPKLSGDSSCDDVDLLNQWGAQFIELSRAG